MFRQVLRIPNGKGKLILATCYLEIGRGRITFKKSPMVCRDEIKVMKGSKWDNDNKTWSVKDCARNRFQLEFLAGGNPYKQFERPVIRHNFGYLDSVLYEHLKLMADRCLTFRKQIIAGEMGTGKTRAAQAVMDFVGGRWIWVGPKPSKENIENELSKFGFSGGLRFLTYENLVKEFENPTIDFEQYAGIIFDEASKLKNENTRRSRAAAGVADYFYEKFVILMTGTPAPKRPSDWWNLTEICLAGFLREGSRKQLEQRLGFFEKLNIPGITANQLIGWRDDTNKCNRCGEMKPGCGCRKFEPSINEVALMYHRLQGLVTICNKADCLDLPAKIYRVVNLKPTADFRKVEKAILNTSPSTIVALTKLRELSDGFQYVDEIETGERNTIEVETPKDAALVNLLEECNEPGRIVIFAGFRASVDRITEICLSNNWNVWRCDGRGHFLLGDQAANGLKSCLDFWETSEAPLAFVAHPESGGMSLTLHAAPLCCFWSNSFKTEFRIQAEDRIHRANMPNRAATIVDLVHLETDQRVLDVLRQNKDLQKMTLTELGGP